MRTDSSRQPDDADPDERGDVVLLGRAARRLTRSRADTLRSDIASVLAGIGEHLGARRAFLTLLGPSREALDDTIAWRQPGLHAYDLRAAPVVEWMAPPFDLLLSGDAVLVADVGDLPADHRVRHAMTQSSERSLAVLPVVSAGRVFGVMGLTRGEATEWDVRTQRLLSWCADAVANTLARVESQRRAEEATAWYRDILDRMSELVCRFDLDGTLSFVNERYASRYGLRPEDMVGLSVFDFVPEHLHADSRSRLSHLMSEGTPQVHVHRTRLDSEGAQGLVEWTDAPITDEDGRVREVVAVGRDVTAREQLSEQLARAASTDDLTGLVNRATLLDQLSARVRRGQRGLAVLFIDLDEFKVVNDTYGHALGDQVLASVGRRLDRAARDGDVVARFGGDEFLVLADGVTHPAEAVAVAERLHGALSEPIAAGEARISVGASIGIALAELASESDDPAAVGVRLVSDADAAMYSAKKATDRHIVVADETTRRDSDMRASRRRRLRSAVEGGEIVPHWQPIVDRDGAVAGVELQLHWTPEEAARTHLGVRDELSASGLLPDVLRDVLARAGDVARAVSAHHRRPVGVWIDVSGTPLGQASLVGHVRHAVEQMPDGCDLVLELTEQSLTEATARSRVHDLAAVGARIALGAFGTVWGSVDALRRVPVDVVMLDASLVARLPGAPVDRAIVDAVVGLARTLDLEVVATGVEVPEQLTVAREAGVTLVQGHLTGLAEPLDRLTG